MVNSRNIIVIILIIKYLHVLEAFVAENSVDITLANRTHLYKEYDRSIFPDIVSLFKVSGPDVEYLTITDTLIEAIDLKQLKKLPNLSTIRLASNKKLRNIHARTFESNPKLITVNLEENAIHFVSKTAFHGLFQNPGYIGRLILQSNKLQQIPIFSHDTPGLKFLNLDNNPIKTISANSLTNLSGLQQLSLQNTDIAKIPSHVFGKIKTLHELRLQGNKQLKQIDAEAFVGSDYLTKLTLSDSKIKHLPHKGLKRLSYLVVQNTPNLWDIPNGLVALRTLKTVKVSENQRFLCCAFRMKRTQVRLKITLDPPNRTLCQTKMVDDNTLRPVITTPRTSVSTTEDEFSGGFGKRRKKRSFFFPTNSSIVNRTKRTTEEDDFFKGNEFRNKSSITEGHVICGEEGDGKIYYPELLPVECTPEPDALRPCDDIMGNVFLTGLSWIVSLVALLGNSTVFSVLILSRRSTTVTKFLLINLSFADLCLALYLFILVSASSHTHGDYYNYVRQWQYGGGCAISGFLAIFSSQLSMLVLVVITVERYFAIVYAMHFHRRLSMNQAKVGIILCWFVSLLMAILPLVGVSSYNEVAICLPFKTSDKGDLVYVGILLLMNVLLFLFVFVSYLRMYWVVRSPHLDCGPQRNDSEVAKRMALLVFTDFFCWGPIAFVGMLSAFGHSESLNLDVKRSKYLLVIFFPINALCNPFLYAASTNSFKKDFFDLLIRCGLCQDSIAKANEGVYTNSVSQFSNRRSSSQKANEGRLSKILLKRRQMSSGGSPLVSTPNLPVFSPTEEASPMLSSHDDTVNRDDDIVEIGFNHPVDERVTSKSEYDNVDQNENLASADDDLVDDVFKEMERLQATTDFSQYDLSREAFQQSKETKVIQ